MYLSSFRIENYKSYRDSGPLALLPGFNVIIGKNDVGKTALVEGLSLSYANQPHKSPLTMPRENTPLPPVSKASGAFRVMASDTSELLEPVEYLFIRTPTGEPPDNAVQRFVDALAGDLTVSFAYTTQTISGALEDFNPKDPQVRNISFINARHPVGTELKLFDPSSSKGTDVGQILAGNLRPRVYAFRAERMRIGSSPIIDNGELATDASNLPRVVHFTHAYNEPLFDEYMDRVRMVFPHITHIGTPPSGGHTRVMLWSTPVESQYAHLATPLSDSGTGISQVLALLYVAVTARHSRTIIIDEPQSFLHPGAVRKLIDVLRLYPQHQYIVTTHSPMALLHTTPSTLWLVERPEYDSVVHQLDPSEATSLRSTLVAVGAQISDVYGADEVLWVEGKTEEKCFPMILEHVLRLPRPGLQISGVVNTGDFETKQADRTFQIYLRLTASSYLMPPALAFVFDREGRTDEQQAALRSRSAGLVQFLPRRMFENYLLDPLAIANVLNMNDDSRHAPLTEEEIRIWITNRGQELVKDAQTRSKALVWSDMWFIEVDGAAVLERLFAELSESRVQYRKVTHGPAILERMIKRNTNDANELAEFIRGILH